MIRINAKHFCDYYKILNVPRNAAEKEIKLSYIKLAKLHHPDKGGASEVFKKIVDAYQTLKDPIKRQLYNKKIKVKHTVVKEQPEDKRVDPEVSKFESELSKIDMDKLFFEFTAKKNKSKANQIMGFTPPMERKFSKRELAIRKFMIAIKQKEAKEKSFFYYFRPKEEDSEEQKSYEDLVKEDIKRMKSFPNVEDNNTAKPKEEENNRDERGLINFLIYSCFGLYCLFMILYFINKKFSKKGKDK